MNKLENDLLQLIREQNNGDMYCSGGFIKAFESACAELERFYHPLKEPFCKFCERELVDEKMRTKNGCIWCDTEYHKEK